MGDQELMRQAFYTQMRAMILDNGLQSLEDIAAAFNICVNAAGARVRNMEKGGFLKREYRRVCSEDGKSQVKVFCDLGSKPYQGPILKEIAPYKHNTHAARLILRPDLYGVAV